MFTKADYPKMKSLMESINWEEEFNKYPEDVNKKLQFFETKFYEAEKQCVPRKLVYINGKLSKKFSFPLDRKNLSLLKKKNKMWSRIRKDIASQEEKNNYNRLRNQIRRRKSKKLVEKKIAKNVKQNPKAFWRYTLSKLKTRPGIPDLEKSTEDDQPTFTKK